MKQKTVLLLGSYGQSNLGDDLLMWNYLELLKERGFQNIYVNANTTKLIPAAVKKKYPDLKIINTYETSVFTYIKIIRKVDCIVYGGGTLYKELYASTGRSPYSVIVRMMGFNMLAKLLGAKVYHLHIGIGSLKTGIGRVITKRAIMAATATIFRDQKSYEYARDILKVPAKKIEKSTDGLFTDHVWESIWKPAHLNIDREKYQRVVGINVLSDIPDWVDRTIYIKEIRQFASELLDRGDYVIFVPFQYAFNPRNDLKFMKETFGDIVSGRKNYTIINHVPLEFAHSYIQQCDVFVGMRFHSLLLSTVSKTPFIAIAYDTKCWRFIEEIDYPYAIKLENLQYSELIKMYDTVFKKRKDIQRRLGVITGQLYNESEESLRTLSL